MSSGENCTITFHELLDLMSSVTIQAAQAILKYQSTKEYLTARNPISAVSIKA